MSYSEVRNFTETIRSLGYPGQLNLSTFFRPNFTVMTDILRWLIDSFSNSNSGISGKRLIDSSELPIELDTETDRVMFVKAAAQLLASRLNIKIHTKRLYQADVMCISELSKLSSVLYKAMVAASQTISEKQEKYDIDQTGNSTLEEELGDITIDDKTAASVKTLRALSSEIMDSGGELYELLQAEVGSDLGNSLNLDRLTSLQKPARTEDIEKSIKKRIAELKQKASSYDQQIARVDEDEMKLDGKIKQKKDELKRSEQRLETLKSVRPAFQDELDDLEEEMKDAYGEYLNIFRNLSYLKSQISDMTQFQVQQAKRVEQAVENDMHRTMDLNYQNEKAYYGDEDEVDTLDSEGDEEIEDLDEIAGEQMDYEDGRGYQQEETDDDDF